MRLSVVVGEPGYQEWRDLADKGIEPRVFVDGTLIPDVLSADDEKGIVVAYVRCPNGIMSVDWNTGAAITNTLRGKVRIELPVVHEAVRGLA